MIRFAVAVALLGVVAVGAAWVSSFDLSPWSSPDGAPSVACREFDWNTRDEAGRDVSCRVLWCVEAVGNERPGGPAVLRCVPRVVDTPDGGAAAGRWW